MGDISKKEEIIDLQSYINSLEPLEVKIKPAQPKLKIAALVSERLGVSLPFECTVFHLTEHNWSDILHYVRPDFIIIESCFESYLGHWRYAQSNGGKINENLLELINTAKNKNIPTVFWQTKSSYYFSLFYSFARNVDKVYCCDKQTKRLFEEEGIPASILPPAIQLNLHNPYRVLRHYADINIPVLYDSICDDSHFKKNLSELWSTLKNEGLIIIDSYNHINKAGDFKDKDTFSIESLNYNTLLSIQKHTMVGLSFDLSLTDPVDQQWRALEAMGCGSVIVHHGKIDANDIRYNLINAHQSSNHFLDNINHLLENEKERLEFSSRIRSYLNKKHTYTNRIESICKDIGIDKYPTDNSPLLTAYSITDRDSELKKILENYAGQTYSNKELIIVIRDRDKNNYRDIIKQYDEFPDITIHKISYTDNYLCACQLCVNSARGEYCIQIGTRNLNNNYLNDVLLRNKAASSDLCGTLPHLYFTDSINHAQILNRQNRTFNSNQIDFKEELLTKVLISSKTDVLRNILNSCSPSESLNTLFKKSSFTLCTLEYINFLEEYGESENDYRLGKTKIENAQTISEKVIAGMASIPSRAETLPEVINRVIDQFDHIYIYLNGYTDIPACLQHEKISYVLSSEYGDLGAIGKFFFLEEVKNGYYFTLDDDFLYPDDYVSRMVSTLKKYKDSVGLCVHGSIFGSPLDWFFQRTADFSAQHLLSTDRFVTLVGSGSLAFHTKSIEICLEDFLPDVKCDLVFSLKAREQGMPLVAISRPEKWLKAIETDTEEKSYWTRMLIDDEGRTEMAQKYDWDFYNYGRIVIEKFNELFPLISDAELKAQKFDIDFISGYIKGLKPEWWDSNNSKIYNKRKLQALTKEKTILEFLYNNNKHPDLNKLFSKDSVLHATPKDIFSIKELAVETKKEIEKIKNSLRTKNR